jgi:hypothetical protein
MYSAEILSYKEPGFGETVFPVVGLESRYFCVKRIHSKLDIRTLAGRFAGENLARGLPDTLFNAPIGIVAAGGCVDIIFPHVHNMSLRQLRHEIGFLEEELQKEAITKIFPLLQCTLSVSNSITATIYSSPYHHLLPAQPI